jgi:hypothetical protein
MGVAGEDDIDEFAPGVLEHRVGVVGFVRHENHRSTGQRRHSEVKPGVGCCGIIDSAKPEA